jgi:hypothetical protein
MFRRAKTLRKPPQTLDKLAFHAFVKMVQACGCISNARKGRNVAVLQLQWPKSGKMHGMRVSSS